MKGRLRIDHRYSKELKSLIFELLFSEKKLSELARDYRHIDGKKFFLNQETFDLKIFESKGNSYKITDKNIDKEFDEFLTKLTRIPCDVKEKENK